MPYCIDVCYSTALQNVKLFMLPVFSFVNGRYFATYLRKCRFFTVMNTCERSKQKLNACRTQTLGRYDALPHLCAAISFSSGRARHITVRRCDDVLSLLWCAKGEKSPGTDGVLSEMMKDVGDVLHNCLLVVFNLMPENLLSTGCNITTN